MRGFSRVVTVAVCVVVIASSVSSRAVADETQVATTEGTTAEPAIDPDQARGTHWKPWWPRFHWVEGVVTVAAEAAAIAIYVAEPYREVRWLDGAPLDHELRDALRIESWDDRRVWVTTSDVLFITMLVWPVAIDALLLSGLVHRDTDTMLQMMLIDAEVLAIAHLVHWLTTRVVGRARPIHRECAATDSCSDRGVGPVASFVSGHSLMAYAASGLVCTHHLQNPWLTGSREGAAIACASSLALATATSAMRVMADLHWASDVGIGAVIGAAIGWVLPLALHYVHPSPRSHVSGDATTHDTARSFTIAARPGAGSELTGLTLFGAF